MKRTFTYYYLFSLVLFSFCCSGLLASAGAPCTQDYQCESIPYEFCSSSVLSESLAQNCSLIPGLGLDSESQKLYFLARCNGTLPPSGVSSHPGTVYLFSANTDGSDITSVTTLAEDTTSNSPQYSVVTQFLALSPFDFYIIRNIRDAISFNSIDRVSFNESVVYTQRDSPAITFDFDLSTGTTFSCYGFNVVQFPAIFGFSVSVSESSTLYPRSDFPDSYVCENVKAVGSTLYILAGDGSVSQVFQGSTNGSTTLSPLFTIFTSSQNRYPAFAADSSAIYFTDEFSVNRDFIDGEHGPSLIFPDHNNSPNFTSLEASRGFLYFDDGVFIHRANTSSLNVDDLIPHEFSFRGSLSNRNGTCTCRPNFNGSDCTSCSGQLQWNSINPSCVPLLENGFPSSCTFDFQCGNIPYAFCSASNVCACRSSFSGPFCSECSNGTISWESNIPTCTLSPPSPTPSSSSSNSSCGSLTISQQLRTSWTEGSDHFYLYDISFENSGAESISTPVFFLNSTNSDDLDITQSWNLVLYATTVPSQRLVSLFPNTHILPSSTFSGVGYVVNGSQTVISVADCASPPSSNSSSPANSSSPSTPSCSSVSLNESLRSSFPNGNGTSYVYDITIQNNGASSITTPTFFIKSTSSDDLDFSQSWNLVLYATTVPTQRLASLFPDTEIASGSSYTAAGFISSTQISLTLESC